MDNFKHELADVSDDDVIQMMNDTSQLVAKHNVDYLAPAAVAAQGSNALTNNVEFWKWMERNYRASGIFASNTSMQQYISQGAGKEEWMMKQLQGKGYERDWITAQRRNPKNFFKTYDAGDVSNRMGSDVTEYHLLTGKSSEYQMKAYRSKTNPHLKNTPKDMTVVTNAEKTSVVKQNGYANVESFQDAETIKNSTDKRMEQIKDGTACPSYNFKNAAGTMAKAGLIGCVIGVGTETIVSYKSWKNGQITDREYLEEILKAGGESAVTSGATAGIMIPVSAAVTAAGASTLLTIPVAFVVGGAVNRIVAPCFGRGKYKEILGKAKYYQSMALINQDLIESMQNASEQYYIFVTQMQRQSVAHQELKSRSMGLNKELQDLYNSI